MWENRAALNFVLEPTSQMGIFAGLCRFALFKQYFSYFLIHKVIKLWLVPNWIKIPVNILIFKKFYLFFENFYTTLLKSPLCHFFSCIISIYYVYGFFARFFNLPPLKTTDTKTLPTPLSLIVCVNARILKYSG